MSEQNPCRWGVKLRGQRVNVAGTDSWPQKRSAHALIANMQDDDAKDARVVKIRSKKLRVVAKKFWLASVNESGGYRPSDFVKEESTWMKERIGKRIRITLEELGEENS